MARVTRPPDSLPVEQPAQDALVLVRETLAWYSAWLGGSADKLGAALAALSRVEQELARLRRLRDEEVDMPAALSSASAKWLVANEKEPDGVRWGRFPLGFVARLREERDAALEHSALAERVHLERGQRIDVLEDECQRLLGENQKLRDGLRRIANLDTRDDEEAVEIARSLLVPQTAPSKPRPLHEWLDDDDYAVMEMDADPDSEPHVTESEATDE